MSRSEREVTHKASGMYIPKFWVGVFASLVTTASVGVFVNLWYLNTAIIRFDQHLTDVQKENATLPGALSRREWALERQILVSELETINSKLDRAIDRWDGVVDDD